MPARAHALSSRLLLGLLVALAMGAAEARPRPRRPVEITLIGDSIAAGLGLPRAQALPAQLQQALRRGGLAAIVRVRAFPGATTADGARRLAAAVPASTRLAVVALGANDLLDGLDPARTGANLERIVARLKARRMAVVLVGIAAPAAIGAAYARDFDAQFAAVARAKGVPLYPDLLAGVAFRPSLEQADGLHPNAAGVRLIAGRLAAFILRAFRSRGAAGGAA